jgi:hypothetical protein
MSNTVDECGEPVRLEHLRMTDNRIAGIMVLAVVALLLAGAGCRQRTPRRSIPSSNLATHARRSPRTSGRSRGRHGVARARGRVTPRLLLTPTFSCGASSFLMPEATTLVRLLAQEHFAPAPEAGRDRERSRRDAGAGRGQVARPHGIVVIPRTAQLDRLETNSDVVGSSWMRSRWLGSMGVRAIAPSGSSSGRAYLRQADTAGASRIRYSSRRCTHSPSPPSPSSRPFGTRSM